MTGLQKHTHAPHQKDLEAKNPGKSGKKSEKLFFPCLEFIFFGGTRHDSLYLYSDLN